MDQIRLSLKDMILTKYPCIDESELKCVIRTGGNTFNLYIESKDEMNLNGKTDRTHKEID